MYVDYIQPAFHEMVEKTGQTNQPCVQLDGNLMLTDISGAELEQYLNQAGYKYKEDTSNVPLDRSCTEEEHAQMALAQNQMIENL